MGDHGVAALIVQDHSNNLAPYIGKISESSMLGCVVAAQFLPPCQTCVVVQANMFVAARPLATSSKVRLRSKASARSWDIQ